MTDIELTKLCAEAMGDEEYPPQEWWTMEDRKCFHIKGAHGLPWVFDPLHDDAQAMGLVKKLKLTCHWHEILYTWSVSTPEQKAIRDGDLNHAICECVAKIQQAKQESGK